MGREDNRRFCLFQKIFPPCKDIDRIRVKDHRHGHGLENFGHQTCYFVISRNSGTHGENISMGIQEIAYLIICLCGKGPIASVRQRQYHFFGHTGLHHVNKRFGYANRYQPCT